MALLVREPWLVHIFTYKRHSVSDMTLFVRLPRHVHTFMCKETFII